mmetsp:Transcript_10320/g.21876  ORF Transcript_10320/g.21876 Transcript_10320/m.21876 type:complete len:915 (+) Transcript_10320:210-2954(+)
MSEYTLSLDSPSSNLSTTGGKGHNLAVLSRDGNFPVPPGFVVTVAAYHAFIRESGALLQDINTALSKLRSGDNDTAGANTSSTAQLEEISDTIRAAFRKRSVSKKLRADIANRLSSIFPDKEVYLAVRSSGTCEDMPDASFAGQHDTYLNVNPTVDNVCKHVVDCFSSIFTSRAIAYRERNGLSHVDAGMAVVVQAMVQSHSSGVLFTANPLTGRRNESVLEVVPGLGEALVSGLTEPDRYVVSVSRSNDSIDIKDKRIGAKMKVIRSVEGGGVTEEVSDGPADGEESTTVLTDEEVKDVIKLGEEVVALFEGNPQDIEWARSIEGKTYIVQSRPITTLFPLPNVPAEPLQVFFSFNGIQGIAGGMTPAGQGAIRGILGGLVSWITWGRYGVKGIFLQSVAERLYGNLTNILRNSIGRKFLCKALTAVEPGILAGVNSLLDEPEMEVNSGMSPLLFARLVSLYSVAIPRAIFSFMFPDRARDKLTSRMNKKIARVEREAEGVDSLIDAIDFKKKTFKEFFPSVVPFFIPRMATAMGPLFILTKLASSIPDGKDLVLTITRGLPHNVTTEMDLKLWSVAKAIQADRKSLEHFRTTDADTLADEYLGERLPYPAQDVVRRFMKEYGMRGLCEIDFGKPRWREEPAPLMQTLKSYVDIPEEHAPDKVFAAGEVAAEKAIERLGQELGKPWLVSFLARRTRSMAGIRELPKFTIIRTMGIIREKMIMEGEKLVEGGRIEKPKDVFLLHDDELRALAMGQLMDAKVLISERKAIMDREEERARVPRVIASDGFAYYGGAVAKANVKEGANVLCGEPVSPGNYEGRIRVVQNPSKTTLNPGEILCCHGTDPSWTPLFLSAGALVMEVGGLMTHGSVVAREYGIPAVVGLEKVTERLTTGQLVRVDGSTGVVEVLEDEAEK